MSGAKEPARDADRISSVRLDRLLAREGLGTRSQLRKAVRAGKVLVNGCPEKDPGRQVLPGDEVLFDGRRVGGEANCYYMLHKPAGVVTATEDGRERTVLDILREKGVLRRGLFPVGRLDKDTEGLLLITDDGALAHALLSPSRHVDKTYYAVVTGGVCEDDVRRFAEGLQVDEDFRALPAGLQVIGDEVGSPDGLQADGGFGSLISGTRIPGDDGCRGGAADAARVLVTIREGKYHQIKRMFEAVGRKVLYLKRLSMGPLRLDPALSPGEFRELTDLEIQQLREGRQLRL